MQISNGITAIAVWAVCILGMMTSAHAMSDPPDQTSTDPPSTGDIFDDDDFNLGEFFDLFPDYDGLFFPSFVIPMPTNDASAGVRPHIHAGELLPRRLPLPRIPTGFLPEIPGDSGGALIIAEYKGKFYMSARDLRENRPLNTNAEGQPIDLEGNVLVPAETVGGQEVLHYRVEIEYGRGSSPAILSYGGYRVHHELDTETDIWSHSIVDARGQSIPSDVRGVPLEADGTPVYSWFVFDTEGNAVSEVSGTGAVHSRLVALGGEEVTEGTPSASTNLFPDTEPIEITDLIGIIGENRLATLIFNDRGRYYDYRLRQFRTNVFDQPIDGNGEIVLPATEDSLGAEIFHFRVVGSYANGHIAGYRVNHSFSRQTGLWTHSTVGTNGQRILTDVDGVPLGSDGTPLQAWTFQDGLGNLGMETPSATVGIRPPEGPDVLALRAPDGPSFPGRFGQFFWIRPEEVSVPSYSNLRRTKNILPDFEGPRLDGGILCLCRDFDAELVIEYNGSFYRTGADLEAGNSMRTNLAGIPLTEDGRPLIPRSSIDGSVVDHYRVMARYAPFRTGLEDRYLGYIVRHSYSRTNGEWSSFITNVNGESIPTNVFGEPLDSTGNTYSQWLVTDLNTPPNVILDSPGEPPVILMSGSKNRLPPSGRPRPRQSVADMPSAAYSKSIVHVRYDPTSQTETYFIIDADGFEIPTNRLGNHLWPDQADMDDYSSDDSGRSTPDGDLSGPDNDPSGPDSDPQGPDNDPSGPDSDPQGPDNDPQGPDNDPPTDDSGRSTPDHDPPVPDIDGPSNEGAMLDWKHAFDASAPQMDPASYEALGADRTARELRRGRRDDEDGECN